VRTVGKATDGEGEAIGNNWTESSADQELGDFLLHAQVKFVASRSFHPFADRVSDQD
jgi:hypothetical protein